MTAPNRRWVWFGLATIFVVVTFSAADFTWRRHSRLQAEVFDAELWRDQTRDGEARRLTMADGLVARGDLKGMSRSDVVEKLGEPPPPEYFKDWDLVYQLGMERGFISIDSEWLVIRLSADGRVTDCRIVRD